MLASKALDLLWNLLGGFFLWIFATISLYFIFGMATGLVLTALDPENFNSEYFKQFLDLHGLWILFAAAISSLILVVKEILDARGDVY